MRIYSLDDEERIRAQAHVRTWARAKLLDSARAAKLEAELRVEVRRTNELLRAGLALFTALVVIAAVLLVGVVLEVRSDIGMASTSAAGAVACVAAAEYLVRAHRLYRYGVEEALAAFSVLLLSFSALFAVVELIGRDSNAAKIAALAVGCVGAFGIYRRFGYVYALVGAAACAVLIPFQFEAGATAQRLMAFTIVSVIFAVAGARRLERGEELPGDDYATLRTASVVGAYLILNLHIWDVWEPLALHADIGRLVYWITYGAIWIIPVAGLRLGIRQRDRELIDVSIVLALATLATNKPYLGWPRREWDPMILGMLLMAGAIALRRWLARGLGGERGGFTPAQILATDRHALSMIATASTAFHPHSASPDPAPGSDFRGGRSGGGGGGGSF